MGTVQRRMVRRGGDPGLPFIEEPGMVGYLLVLEEDLDPLPEFMRNLGSRHGGGCQEPYNYREKAGMSRAIM